MLLVVRTRVHVDIKRDNTTLYHFIIMTNYRMYDAILCCSLSLVSIHVLVGRTTARDASRCMDTNDHNQSQPSQQKHASSQQSRTC